MLTFGRTMFFALLTSPMRSDDLESSERENWSMKENTNSTMNGIVTDTATLAGTR